MVSIVPSRFAGLKIEDDEDEVKKPKVKKNKNPPPKPEPQKKQNKPVIRFYIILVHYQ